MEADRAAALELIAILEGEQERADRLDAMLRELIEVATPAVGHLTGYGETSTVRISLRDTLERARLELDKKAAL